MDKLTSIIAALDAGKLPTTEQICLFVDWIDKKIVPSTEPGVPHHLTSQGALLARRLREVLNAYKPLLNNKNHDNALQEALWHLELAEPPTPKIDTEAVSEDVRVLHSAVRALMSIAWSSVTSESSSLLEEFASFTRLSLADAAELVERSASQAKESLRQIEQGIQAGQRTAITGREKSRVEAEQKDVKVQWEHGVDVVKSAGDSVIDSSRSVASSVQEVKEKTTNRARDAYLKICERAQSDPAYREAVESLLTVLERMTHHVLETASPDNLESLFEDTTSDQHLRQALNQLQTLFERLCAYPLSRLIARVRVCLDSISRDPALRQWFDEFFALAKKNLIEQGYVETEESHQKRQDLREKWNGLVEREDGKWQKCVDGVKVEFAKIQDGLAKDKDLQRLRAAHAKLTHDLEQGLVEAGEKAETGLEAMVERATWFWQDMFKVYIPHVLESLTHLPIPRTEYKDDEIEFVLENLDISSLNILPSHVYIRNITDVDIRTSSTTTGGAHTAIGTLTRVKIDAVQLKLNDVSFWYKDLMASALSPSEFSGILALELPPQGISLDLKIRLIPSSVPSSNAFSRQSLGHFYIIEHVAVRISEDVKLEVKDSNHGVLLAIFKPIFLMRLREALERTLTQQVRALVEWTDGVAWDIGKRKEVLEDMGTVRNGAALMAAIWSEVGRFRREMKQRGAGVMFRATGTGIVVEQKEAGKGEVLFAMGAEPQILSGQKRGPLGIGSEPLGKRVVEMVEGVADVRIGEVVEGAPEDVAREATVQIKETTRGLVQAGVKDIETFQNRVDAKKREELRKPSWKSDAFEI